MARMMRGRLALLVAALAGMVGCRASVAVKLPRGWTAETRRVKVATPKGEEWKTITYYTNSIGMNLVRIPAGEFLMGSPETEKERYTSEGPVHRVRITEPFLIGAFEVTQAEYEQVMGKNPSRFKGAENPMERVLWRDVVGFCRRLSQKEGLAYALPTEAQWEYACRAGSTTPFYFGETISTDQANYNGNYAYGRGAKGVYREKTLPVGSFPPNAFGLYDMHGNVWEWCQDRYQEDYYRDSPEDDPPGPDRAEARVLRGGSWYFAPRSGRSAYRYRGFPSPRYSIFGGRVVLRDFQE